MKRRRLCRVVVAICILCLTIAGTRVPRVVAAEGDELSVQKSFLREIGAPEDYLNTLAEVQINYLYNKYVNLEEEVVFAGYESKIVEINEQNTAGVIPYAQIPSNQLKLTMGVVEIPDANNKVSAMYVDVMYQWLTEPFWHMKDAHTFNFNPNYFYMAGFDSFSMYDSTFVDGDSVPATACDSGVGWYLSTSRPSHISGSSKNFGGASIILKPKRSYNINTGLGINLFYQYAHQIAGASISLGMSSSGPSAGIGMTGGSYDLQTFTYYY